jgi:hypothetical protein
MGEKVFFPSTTQYAPTGEFTDADGKTWVFAIAHGTLVAKTLYGVITNEYGNVTIAAPSGAVYCYLGVPDRAYASGTLAKIQIGGYLEDMITPSITSAVGYALVLIAGVITLVSADYTGAVAEFAALTEVSTAETHDVMLCGHMVLARAS